MQDPEATTPAPKMPRPTLVPNAQNVEINFDVNSGRLTLVIDTHARLDGLNTRRIATTSGDLKLSELMPGLVLNLKCWQDTTAPGAVDIS